MLPGITMSLNSRSNAVPRFAIFEQAGIRIGRNQHPAAEALELGGDVVVNPGIVLDAHDGLVAAADRLIVLLQAAGAARRAVGLRQIDPEWSRASLFALHLDPAAAHA